eukprot:1761729-Prymnesium_polylepis.1
MRSAVADATPEKTGQAAWPVISAVRTDMVPCARSRRTGRCSNGTMPRAKGVGIPKPDKSKV